MRFKWVAGAVCLVAMCAPAWPQGTQSSWLGVWQSKLDGQPGAIVTLANDSGQLGGTIVLNLIQRKDGPARVIGSEAHELLSPRVSENTLTFAVKRPRAPYSLADFVMTMKSDGTATIHCTNCGGAPTVELTREW